MNGVLRAWYAARWARRVRRGPVPAHVAMIMDGNRRWARGAGYANPSVGHRHGAEHLETVLGWCAELGIRHVTVYVASADNLRKRDEAEVAFLMRVVEEVVVGRVLPRSPRWRLAVAGRLDLVPDSTAHALKAALGGDGDSVLTVAIGYDGREEIVDAVRSLLDSAPTSDPAVLARSLTADDIARHLPGAGRPDPELVVRTSGELRMSGFLLWQAAHAELHFCDVHWPGFRKVDFLRALRAFQVRRAS
ncbi:polyprenyl diphosphate synthase [Actinosynnema sp. NPDC020468]|uniref:polyprenyl diphosphate synthase n=1 Tax=Actinosynnema sp. NPDC020468 TaxID=3154488 RepID=UPI0033F02BEE